MSNVIDREVVEMRFDNKQFEAGVQQSMESVSDLKKSLDFTDSGKGLDNINASAKGIDMTALTESVGIFGTKISAVGLLGVHAFLKIADAAWNAGKRIVSALTIDPIKTGFQEYETKMNAIQTILANTQGGQKKVSQEDIQKINDAAAQAAAASISSNKATLESTKKLHKQEIKDYQKTSKEELEIVRNKNEEETEMLSDALDEERQLLSKAHADKLKLYESEYMAKLKVADEQKYNQIKDIEEQIKSLQNLTTEEEEAAEAAEENAQRFALLQNVDLATNEEEKKHAEEELANFRAQLAKKQMLKDRENQIKALEASKDKINEEYSTKVDKIKNEYDAKRDAENDLYTEKAEALAEEQNLKREVLAALHDEELTLIHERQNEELDAINERQEAEMEALNSYNDVAIAQIEERKKAEINALNETAEVSKATTLEEVNAALDELNRYADKTIYNFAEMTNNLGKFTAAGVGLDESIKSIKGIANLAAVSGANSQKASVAMYQMSQALSSGTVRLQDWMSMEHADIGGKVFQESLKETARVHGIAIDDMIAKEGTFRLTLQNGWLTADIMNETLEKFTMSEEDMTEAEAKANRERYKSIGYTDEQIEGIFKLGKTATDAATKVKTFTQLYDTLKESAQSGWTETWEIIVGDFEEAKETLTEIKDIFGGIIDRSAEARNEVLQIWKNMGGREDLIQSFRNLIDAIGSIITPIKEAFSEIFPPVTFMNIYKITKSIKEFTASLTLNEKTSEDLKNTFKGIFSVLRVLQQVIGAILKLVEPIWSILLKVGSVILSITGYIGKLISGLNDTIVKSEIFAKVMDGIINFFKKAVQTIKEFVSSVVSGIDFSNFESFGLVLERMNERLKTIGDTATTVKEKITSFIDSVSEKFKESKFYEFLSKAWAKIKEISEKMSVVFKGLATVIKNQLGDISFDQVIDGFNTGFFGVLAIAIARFLKFITKTKEKVQDGGGIVDFLKAELKHITNVFDAIKGCLESLQTSIKANVLIKIAIAVGMIAASALVLSLIDSRKLAEALTSITVMFGELMGSLAIFSKLNNKLDGSTDATNAMLTMSAAVLILAFALKKISDIESNKLGSSLLAIEILLGSLIATFKLMESEKATISKGAGQLILMAIAVGIFAVIATRMSSLNWTQLAVSGAALGGIITALIASAKIMDSNSASITKFGGQMILMSIAVGLFAIIAKKMSEMQWDELARSGAAMGGIMILLVAAAKIMDSNSASITKFGGQMIVLSAALGMFALVAIKMSELSWEELAKAGASLVVMIGLLVAAAKIMDSNSSSVSKFGAQMLLMSVALGVFAVALKTLGKLKISEIAKGLGAIAAAFIIVGVAGKLLQNAVPAVVGFAAAITLIGAGFALAGLGIMKMALAFTLITGVLTVSAVAISNALKVIITTFAELIPLLATKFAEGLLNFLTVINDGMPTIKETIKNIIFMILDVLVESIPEVVGMILKLIVDLLAALAENAPTIIGLIFDFLVNLLTTLAERIPDLIVAAVDLIMAIFQGVIDAFNDIDVSVIADGLVKIAIIDAILTELALLALLAPGALAGIVAFGAVVTALTVVLTAIGCLAQIPGIEWIVGEGKALLAEIGGCIGAFIGGIIGGLAAGITNSLPEVGLNLSQFMLNATPFLIGISSITNEMVKNVGALTSMILLLTAADIISGVTSWLTGGTSFADFGTQLVPFGESLVSFSDTIKGRVDSKAVTAAACAGKMIAQMASELPNSGGVAGFFAGENDMDEFGTQLVSFGTSLASFSAAVHGKVNKASVIAAADAGQAMSTMSATIANSGGFVSLFTGDNKLDEFGEQMVPFGESLASFSAAVNGKVNLDAISNAAKAGEYISEWSSTLENSGGVAGFFAGNNDIDEFGTQLASFGTALAGFSAIIDGSVKSATINAAIKSSASLAALVQGLPDDYRLATFGENLANFGPNFKIFCDDISTMDKTAVKSASESLDGIIEVANSILPGTSTSLTQLSDGLIALAKSGIDDFIEEFKNADTDIKEAIDKFMDKFITAAKEKETDLEATFKMLYMTCATAMGKDTSYVDFKNAGTDGMIQYREGVKSQTEPAETTFMVFIGACLQTIKNYHDKYKEIGSFLVQGFADGIEINIWIAEKAAAAMASAAAAAAMAELDEHSPSKVFYKIGAYGGQGFVNALLHYADIAYTAGQNLGSSANDGLNEAISKIVDVVNNDIDSQPTIRPVLDLSNVISGTKSLDAMFSRTQAIAVNSGIAKQQSANEIQNGVNSTTGGSTFQFTQINNSPKALSTIDIYRQTHNQFEVMKGLVSVR